MRAGNTRSQNQRGSAEVEAIFIMPIAILSVLLLLYLALFLFQRANLQAGLETALVYYKNTVTDTYVKHNSDVTYTGGDGSSIGAGNSYSAGEPLSPYRGMFGDGSNIGDAAAFKKFFLSVAGNQLFDDDPQVTVEFSNYIYLKQIHVTVTQKVDAPIDFSILGVGNEYTISASARVAVVDHDTVIRDLDYAIDLLEDTKLGEWARNFAAKAGEIYGKIKEVLHM